MLHAWRLGVRHPETETPLRFEAPVPSEFPRYPFNELPWRDSAELA